MQNRDVFNRHQNSFFCDSGGKILRPFWTFRVPLVDFRLMISCILHKLTVFLEWNKNLMLIFLEICGKSYRSCSIFNLAQARFF